MSPLDFLITKHKKLFSPYLGTLRGTSDKLVVEPNAIPQFVKPHTVPYCLKEKVGTELLDMNVITPVTFSDWTAPIVQVIKQAGTIRLCGDY